ncbi:hypothetical protein DB30_07820 [Enhygromyxa salina]|uniref:Uncharacterized protein n=1 Tax=Enhygromyxa salina TaxID=215803 RepID=A0A0C2D0D9_9BACT|nr:hypothetical protein DB30_07820 [Enhygromyxa salina]
MGLGRARRVGGTGQTERAEPEPEHEAWARHHPVHSVRDDPGEESRQVRLASAAQS